LSRIAARAVHKDSGRVLEVFTTQPGVQLYTSNFLDGTLLGKNKTAYKKYQALCLETQGFPDAINHSHFPSIVLKPGEKYQESTIFNFYTLA
jgi:aldose 1-epimerase